MLSWARRRNWRFPAQALGGRRKGLQSIDEDDDTLSAMALELVERNGIGETADSVWRALGTEHQKLFSGNSRSADDASSIAMLDILRETQPDPSSPVEGAMDTAS